MYSCRLHESPSSDRWMSGVYGLLNPTKLISSNLRGRRRLVHRRLFPLVALWIHDNHPPYTQRSNERFSRQVNSGLVCGYTSATLERHVLNRIPPVLRKWVWRAVQSRTCPLSSELAMLNRQLSTMSTATRWIAPVTYKPMPPVLKTQCELPTRIDVGIASSPRQGTRHGVFATCEMTRYTTLLPGDASVQHIQ